MTEAAEKVPTAEEDLPPLRPPSADNGLFAVFHRRYLLKLLVQREISARYQGSFLGLLWSYINPLSQFFIYWFVIGVILGQHRGVPNFPIHLFAALIIVHFFNETFGAGTRSIVRNRALVVKMAMPREMFPVATMLVSLYHVIPQIVILGVAAALLGWRPDAEGLAALVLALAIIGTLGTAGALMFSAANVFFSDFGNAVSIFNNFVRFGVTMMYPYSMVHEKFGSAAQYFLLNPIADAVLLFQRAFWTGTLTPKERSATGIMPDNLMLVGVLALLASMVLLVISQLVFSRLENKIPERL
ncbi:ABC transporter permease [Pimelobacter simplex]|uniref:ABC transporter permease n=1 Tax=Nocardioides simplex TaxID=2045 RepID=UPI00214FB87C|nr:ABC transporter permease [Pimelobacter simplex]UUW89559.1 ABC transporter permease [Pimelobacter simplex]UUW93388.1 ABC transporter permease [Pimelobacter simplex]